MKERRFHLIATVSTDNSTATRPVLKELLGDRRAVEEVAPRTRLTQAKESSVWRLR